MGAADDVAALLRRLEDLLVERQELIERLERVLQGDGADDLRGRLARLTQEQERVLAKLTALLPPEEGRAERHG